MFVFIHTDTADSSKYVSIVTPSDPTRRGAQLSLQFSFPINEVYHQLQSRGVVVSMLVTTWCSGSLRFEILAAMCYVMLLGQWVV